MHVIGVTGMPGSGKSVAVDLVRDRGLPVVRMGDLIWEEVDRQGLPRKAENVGKVADAMRQSHGPDIWAQRTVQRVREVAKDAATVLIDGVRSLAEVMVLRRELGEDFHLVAIICPTDIRHERMLGRGRDDDPDDRSALVERDERELSWGLGQVIEAADVVISNEDDLESFRTAFAEVLRDP